MTSRLLKSKIGGTVLLALLIIATGRAQMNQTPAPSTPPAQSPSQPPPSGQLPGAGQLPSTGQAPGTSAQAPVDKAEEDAYKAFLASHGPGDPTQEITLGEAFVAKYPNSRYLPSVYAALAIAYLSTGDSDKMLAAAQKTIDLDPDNVDALSLLVWAKARTVNPGTAGAAEEFVTLENYAHHAIQLVSTMAKPANLTDEQFTAAKNDNLSMCHSGLGLIEYKTGKYAESVSDLTQSIQLANTPDPVDYFILGHAYDMVQRYDDAVGAFMKCSTDGPMQARCQAGLDDAKKKALLAPAPSATPATSAPGPAPSTPAPPHR
jgi:tetratricopeptide (TPR) repeat protein